MSGSEKEEFRGDLDMNSICAKNKPANLNIYEIHLDGDLLYLQGSIIRGGKSKEIIWAYRRIRK